MARKTNKAQVLELAARLGVEVEYGQMGDDGFEVALYGYAAHMAFDPMGEGHTAITNQAGTGARTEARVWGLALADLREFVPCADNCHCRATTPFESMRTMIALTFGVSRETVRLWETDNDREYGFELRTATGDRAIH